MVTKLQKDLFFILTNLISFLIGALMIIEIAKAEDTPWEFKIENDVVIPGQHDRFLSNAFEIKYGAFALGNEMYTPQDKRSREVDTGDRPWDGYSYLEYETVKSVGFGEEFSVKSRLGLVGNASGSKDLQRYVHDDLGFGIHPTWEGQNKSEPTVDFLITRRNREYLQSIIGDSRLTTEYGARLGTVVDEIFLDQELRKHFFTFLYFYGGFRGSGVLYNTHLDGRMFQDDYYTVDRIPFVAEARIGVEYYQARNSPWFVRYEWKYLTEEFKGQEGRHAYGGLALGKRF